MINVFRFVSPDECCECGNKHSIDLYDMKGRLYNYTLLLNNIKSEEKIKQFINTHDLCKFKCRKCNKEFKIEWKRGFPIPLGLDEKIDKFIDNLKE